MTGFIPIVKKDMPSKGVFYPRGLKIMLRAATTAEIKTYSSMDEDNILEINGGMTTILKSCLEFEGVDGFGVNNLLEIDKLFLVIYIRDVTFPEPPEKLFQTIETPSGAKLKIEIKHNLIKASEIEEKYMRHYNSKEGCFVINHDTFSSDLRLKPTTIGVMDWISEHIFETVRRTQQEDSIDKAFLAYIQIADVDPGQLRKPKYLKAVRLRYNQMSHTEHSVLGVYQKALGININTEIEVTDPATHKAFRSPITFPIKSLFAVQSILEELFGDSEPALDTASD